MRIQWIDVTKGLAILCVILGHMGSINIVGINLNFVYAFHLPVFFILSGYTLKKREITVEYINKKFDRLMCPYFLTCLSILLMDIFNKVFIDSKRTIIDITEVISKDIIRSFLGSGAITDFAGIETGVRIGAIWFLPAIFFSQIIVQWILNKSNNAMVRWGVIGSIALIGYISSQFIWLPFSIQSAMTASLFILVGYYLNKYDVLYQLRWKHYIGAVVVFIIGIKKQYIIGIVANSYPDIFLTPLIAIAGSVLLIRIGIFFENSEILCWFGKNSLVILCAHLFAMETLYVYFSKISSLIKITEIYWWSIFFLHVLFSVIVVKIISFYKKVILDKIHCQIEVGGGRNYAVDIAKGIFIVSMLIGHNDIDPILRKIIYSCHMVGFVFFSGYFYKVSNDIKTTIYKLAKSFLVPYIVFCLLHLLTHLNNISSITFISYLKTYILGMSFAKRVFINSLSVGPVYFILLLFCIRIIYLFIDKFMKSMELKFVIVLGISFTGKLLGNYGFWLPWSLDCAAYTLIFYYCGICFKRYQLLETFARNRGSYFFFSIVWSYMIYACSMELAIRRYEPYGLVILGALSGIIIIYMLSVYIEEQLPFCVSRLFYMAGKNTLYILILHACFGKTISELWESVFAMEGVFHLFFCVTTQMILGICTGELLGIFEKRFRDKSKGLVEREEVN